MSERLRTKRRAKPYWHLVQHSWAMVDDRDGIVKKIMQFKLILRICVRLDEARRGASGPEKWHHHRRVGERL